MGGAQKMVGSLKEEGYNSFVFGTTSDSKKTWYKICIGEFESFKEANEYLKELKERKDEFEDCFVRKY